MSQIDNVPESIVPIKSTMTGAFRGQPVHMEYYGAPKSNKLVVNLHGTFGDIHWGSGKYAELARGIAGKGLANTMLYSSSRDWKKAQELSDSYESKIATFQGKTFADELEDARRVVAQAVQNSKKQLQGGEELEVILNGNSLGGIIAFYLAREFPEIKAIVTVGTGLRTEKGDVPILDTFPDEEEVRNTLANYKGKFIMQFGTADTVFSQESFEDLFETVWTEEKSYVCYVWVDHSFKSVDGEPSKEIYQTATNQLEQLLETGELVEGEIRLTPPSKVIAAQDRYARLTQRLVDHIGGNVRVSMEDEKQFPI
jgi:dienelactone hydrolase